MKFQNQDPGQGTRIKLSAVLDGQYNARASIRVVEGGESRWSKEGPIKIEGSGRSTRRGRCWSVVVAL